MGGERNALGESMRNVTAGLREAVVGLGQITAAAVTNVGREISTGLNQHLGEGEMADYHHHHNPSPPTYPRRCTVGRS